MHASRLLFFSQQVRVPRPFTQHTRFWTAARCITINSRVNAQGKTTQLTGRLHTLGHKRTSGAPETVINSVTIKLAESGLFSPSKLSHLHQLPIYSHYYGFDLCFNKFSLKTLIEFWRSALELMRLFWIIKTYSTETLVCLVLYNWIIFGNFGFDSHMSHAPVAGVIFLHGLIIPVLW